MNLKQCLGKYVTYIVCCCWFFVFQKSFIEAGIKSHEIEFSSKASDIDSEIMEAVASARKVSKGNLGTACVKLSGMFFN